MSKFLIELGIFPVLNACGLCGESFDEQLPPFSIGAEEGFLCGPCATQLPYSVLKEDLFHLVQFMALAWKTKYSDIPAEQNFRLDHAKGLIDFFAQQYQLDKQKFKTLGFCVN